MRTGTDDIYDKAVKTIVQDAVSFLIPLINYLFGENFSSQASIKRISEQAVRTDETGRHRMLMDIHVVAEEGDIRKEYIIEVQSTADGGIFVRIVQYALGAALNNIEHRIVNGKPALYVQLPQMGLVYLRPPKGLQSPVVMHIEASVQEGIHEIQVLRMDQITLKEIIDRDLLFLIPFYLFRYAAELSAIEQDPDRFQELMAEYRQMMDELNSWVDTGKISRSECSLLAVLTEEVADALAVNHKEIKEGITNMLRSDVIPWRLEDIRQASREEGEAIGQAIGIEVSETRALKRMLLRGDRNEDILEIFPDMTADRINEMRQELKN